MKMSARSRFYLISITLFIISQTLFASPYPQQVTELVARAKARVPTIDMHAFKHILDQGKYDLILDVREPQEFAQGHIPNAVNLPRGVVEFKIWPLVGYPDHTRMDMHIYVYCGTGSRCILATQSLRGLGFTQAIAVDLNMEEWEKAGYPVTEAELNF